jgi:hypothetical protein
MNGGLPVFLPRRAGNLGVGAGGSKWLYYFAESQSAVPDDAATSRVLSGTLRMRGKQLEIESKTTGCRSVAISIYSALGQCLGSKRLEAFGGRYTVDVHGLAVGGYLLMERACEGVAVYKFGIAAGANE